MNAMTLNILLISLCAFLMISLTLGKPNPSDASSDTKKKNCDCGFSERDEEAEEPRIIGGTFASSGEFPMIVPLLKKQYLKQFCAGTIITSHHILTAGHCMFTDFGPILMLDKIGVVFGAFNILEVTQKDIISPIKAILHNKYVFEVKFDLCMLVMADEIKTTAKVGPACLPVGRFDFSGKILDHAGWGLTKAHKFGANKLKKTKLHVVDRKVCMDTYKGTDYFDHENEYQVCTFQNGTSQCQGDSGGPVLWKDPETNKFVLVGAISFGWPSCDSPSAITDVSYFSDWIQKTIANTVPGTFTCSCKD